MPLIGFCECKMAGHFHKRGWLRRRECGRQVRYVSVVGEKRMLLCTLCGDMIQFKIRRPKRASTHFPG